MYVGGAPDGGRGAGPTALSAQASLRGWHDRLPRFETASELSRLNSDTRARVPASRSLCEFATAALWAAQRTGGLVDPTLLGAIGTPAIGRPCPSRRRPRFRGCSTAHASGVRLILIRRLGGGRSPSMWSDG